MQQHQRDNRRSKRNPKRQAAWIAYGSNQLRVPCMIWDLSEGGARLAAPRSKSLPGSFHLILNKDTTARRACRVAWRNEAQLGVQFIAADELHDFDTAPPKTRQTYMTQRPSRAAATQRPGAAAPDLIAQRDAFISLRSVGVNDAACASDRRSGSFFSSTAAVLLTLLATATLIFQLAGLRGEKQGWAAHVCDATGNFCEHPEMVGVASVLMGLVFLAAKGTAR